MSPATAPAGGAIGPTHVHQLIGARAGATGDAPALAHGQTTANYAELWHDVTRMASGLLALGLEPGDRVAIYLEKRIETVVAIFGTSAARGVFVPINPVLRPAQVGHIVHDSGAKLLVTSTERYELIRDELDGCDTLERVILLGGQVAASADAARITAWHDLSETETAPAEGGEDDLAAILYTSGSTGRPKGVVLSHRNLLVGARSVCSYLGNDETDRILAVLPLSFDAGLSQLTTGFLAGAKVILLDYLLPGDAVRACAEHSITGLTCVPPLWVQLAEQDWPPEASGSMRYFASTGGRMPQTTLERLRAIFPQAKPYLMYGLTEAFRSTYLDPAEVDRRPDSIGKAIPDAEVLVVREDGSPCDPDEEGELVHCGPLVAQGYWRDPERTAERFRPPPAVADSSEELAVWSGDVVRRDGEGFIYFVGRNDEMIKTSGYRVSPTEVEEVAYGTGLVHDAIALGVADERIGERIVLAVSPPEGAEIDEATLSAKLREELPPFMLPKQIVVRDALPRSPNGKLDRNRVREELAT